MIIIAIAKDKIITAEINPGAKEKILQSYEFGWTSETLDLAFAEIVKRFKTKKFRILVADEFSYAVRLDVDENLSHEAKRDYITDQLKEKIPESLEAGEWDYKEVGVGSALVFALVGDFYKTLSSSIENVGLMVEAIEPEVVAKTRDANPIIGLAMKEDIAGRDEEVLNITLKDGKKATETETEGETQEVSKEEETKSEKKGVLTFRMSFTTLILLILFVIGLIVLAKMFLFKKPEESVETPQVTLTPTLAPMPTVEPTPEEEVDVSGYKVQVQSGSGVVGEAGSVKVLLDPIGFSTVDTGNADKSDYVETQVKMKEGINDQVLVLIKEALVDYEVVKSDETLAEDSEYDVVVIVGKKRD